MRLARSHPIFSAVSLLSLLALLLLPAQSALAGGCCLVATIKSLDTGRVFVSNRGQVTDGYDFTSFRAFTDFQVITTAPARSGPAYEVDRDGWDHLLYYPGVAGAPGAVYYEGLYNGSSEYDHHWYAVPPEQDAALRRVLAAQGLTPATAQRQWFFVLAIFAITALGLASLYLALGAYTRPPTRRALTAAAAR